LEALQQQATSVYGQQAWQPGVAFIPFSHWQAAQWEVELLKTWLLQQGEPLYVFPLKEDVAPLLQRLAVQAPLGLASVCQLLKQAHSAWALLEGLQRYLPQAYQQMLQAHPHCPVPLASLFEAVQAVVYPAEVLTHSQSRYHLEADTLKDSASPLLFALRQKQRNQQAQRIKELERLAHPNGPLAAYLTDFYYTQRQGHDVLPVMNTHKQAVGGTVWEVSPSGQTLYMEPPRLALLHQAAQETAAAIEAETERLLQESLALLHPYHDALRCLLATLATVERALCAARLALKWRGEPLTVNPEEAAVGLYFKQLRHPLLVLQAGSKVVPNTVALGAQSALKAAEEASSSVAPSPQSLIITGPNTGGKSVLLQAVGLAVLMVQAGLQPPVAQGSAMAGCFGPVLALLGDAQDLSQNLSTFSGQMSRLAMWLAPSQALTHALVLMDELASGTDPSEGAALAAALLEALHTAGAHSILTTHLGALKVEGHEQAGYLNASMAFNPNTLEPTYTLVVGLPGNSHALSIGQRLGLPPAVLASAQSRLTQSEQDLGQLLAAMEQERFALQAEHQQQRQLSEALHQRLQEAKTEQQAFRESRSRLSQAHQQQVKGQLLGVEQELKRLRKALLAQEAQGQLTPALWQQQRQRFGQLQQQSQAAMAHLQAQEAAEVAQANGEAAPQEACAPATVWQVGQRVRCEGVGVGVLESLSSDGKRALLRQGNVSVRVKVNTLQALDAPLDAQAAKALKQAEKRQLKKQVAAPASPVAVPKLAQSEAEKAFILEGLVLQECRVLGLHVEEALDAVQRFLDEAWQQGWERVGIIHGQGTGALKQAVRQYLPTHPAVRMFCGEAAYRGGEGKTVVLLKV
jgi:DNA mismatch repair protein MutS2